MPDEPGEIAATGSIAAAGSKVVELLGACAASPDDLETGLAADDALRRLEQLLARN